VVQESVHTAAEIRPCSLRIGIRAKFKFSGESPPHQLAWLGIRGGSPRTKRSLL